MSRSKGGGLWWLVARGASSWHMSMYGGRGRGSGLVGGRWWRGRMSLLMSAGVTEGRKEGKGRGQNRRKEECRTFHYLIQIVSLGDKRQDI